jgi:hypothetical protein
LPDGESSGHDPHRRILHMITKNSFNQLLLNDWFLAAAAVVIVAILFIFPIRSLWSIASKAFT